MVRWLGAEIKPGKSTFAYLAHESNHAPLEVPMWVPSTSRFATRTTTVPPCHRATLAALANNNRTHVSNLVPVEAPHPCAHPHLAPCATPPPCHAPSRKQIV